MVFAGIKVPDTILVRDAIELSRSVVRAISSQPCDALLAIWRVAFRKC